MCQVPSSAADDLLEQITNDATAALTQTYLNSSRSRFGLLATVPIDRTSRISRVTKMTLAF